VSLLRHVVIVLKAHVRSVLAAGGLVSLHFVVLLIFLLFVSAPLCVSLAAKQGGKFGRKLNRAGLKVRRVCGISVTTYQGKALATSAGVGTSAVLGML